MGGLIFPAVVLWQHVKKLKKYESLTVEDDELWTHTDFTLYHSRK